MTLLGIRRARKGKWLLYHLAMPAAGYLARRMEAIKAHHGDTREIMMIELTVFTKTAADDRDLLIHDTSERTLSSDSDCSGCTNMLKYGV